MGKPENRVETALNDEVESLGGFTRKWTGRSGVQDRICFLPHGEVWFIEVKVKDGEPEPHQLREILRQRVLGHNSGYIAGVYQVKAFLSCDDRVEWMNKQMGEL